jgi:hypothetical protein
VLDGIVYIFVIGHNGMDAIKLNNIVSYTSGVPRGGRGVQPPPPSPQILLEIPKALQNRAKLNPIVKTVKNCWILDANTPRCSEKKAVKF